jgi:2-C-methyl-D-erythritol 4-phosphate cytidylyltransferase
VGTDQREHARVVWNKDTGIGTGQASLNPFPGNVEHVSTSVAAIVLAGGSGSRVQRNVNKVYLPIRERDMLEYSLETMDRSPRISEVALVVREDDLSKAELLIAETMPAKLTTVVMGGASRHQSELAGLRALAPRIASGHIEVVAIHDGARPFMTLELLDRIVDTAIEHGGAIPGLVIEEPLYRTTPEGVEMLPPRSLRRVQTPQAFLARPLLAAYEASVRAGFEGVDTAETIERFSDLRIRIVPGDPRNIKVTFVEDFFSAEEYALEWDKGAWRAR